MSESSLPFACGQCGARYYGEGAAESCCGYTGGVEVTDS